MKKYILQYHSAFKSLFLNKVTKCFNALSNIFVVILLYVLVTDGGSHSSGPPSLERDDRLRVSDKRIAVEERRKQLWEAEQVNTING